MRRGWVLLLLLSVGLNVGLGYGIVSRDQAGDEEAAMGPARVGGTGLSPRTDWPEDPDLLRQQARRGSNRLARRLQLDPTQETAFRHIRLAAWPEINTHRRAIHQARQRLHAACLSHDIEADSVRWHVRHLVATQGRLDSLIAETLLQELTLLTPSQRQRYLETMPWDRPGPRAGRSGRHHRESARRH